MLVDDGGTLVARGTAPGATGHLFAEVEHARFTKMVAAIAAALPARPDAIHIGSTGLGPTAHDEARAILSAALKTPRTRITLSDDMELGYRAVFAPGAGHLIAAGTGSVGLHITAGGELIRVGGRGILIDDGGSGSWIALTALDRLYRRIDETGHPANAKILYDAIMTTIGGSGWDDIRSFVYGSDRGRIGTLAKTVAEAAEAGDPVARGVLDDAVAELARLAQALRHRAGALPVGFIGGVLELTATMKPALRNALPEAEVLFPSPDAALTAAQIARHAFAADSGRG